MNPTPPPKTSTLAIVALVCTLMCWPLGLILGIVALVKINNSNGAMGGKGLALASVVISGLMVPVMGILAAIAIPNFVRYQNRSKSMEARTNLAMLRSLQESKHADWEHYLAVPPHGGVPGPAKAAWSAGPCNPGCSADAPEACGSFSCLDFQPYGQVYFRYACAVNEQGSAYTCAALGDLDGDGEYSLWAVTGGEGAPVPVPDFSGRSPACPGLAPAQVTECVPGVY